jgi:hypothetical protein
VYSKILDSRAFVMEVYMSYFNQRKGITPSATFFLPCPSDPSLLVPVPFLKSVYVARKLFECSLAYGVEGFLFLGRIPNIVVVIIIVNFALSI